MEGERHESYLDIVWHQFQQNRAAYLALWLLAPLFGVAVCAPLIASNQPLVFFDGNAYLYPWWRALFHPEEPVDFAFNMALLAAFPWLPFAVVANRRWKWHGMTGRKRFTRLLAAYLLATVFVIVAGGVPWFRPSDKYRSRTFAQEELEASGTKRGWYPPIPFGPIEQDLQAVFKPPLVSQPPSDWRESNDGFPHLFGTDNAGRDVLVVMLYGTRLSITVGFIAVGLYLTIGSALGAIAGYFGGKIDTLICRMIEVILLFPSFFLILTLVAMIGPSIYIIMFVIGITGWPTIARLIRGEVLKQRAGEYIVAAQAMGLSHTRIIFRHLLPNSLTPALVAAPFGIAGAIITEAGLSLLGFGVRPPAPSWGRVLKLGSENYHSWWLVIVPSVAIFITVTVFNLVGNGLRDAMDPRLRQADAK